MFSVKCFKTDRSLILNQTELLILLRQFEDGYERWFKICTIEIGEVYKIQNELYDTLYKIKRIQ